MSTTTGETLSSGARRYRYRAPDSGPRRLRTPQRGPDGGPAGGASMQVEAVGDHLEPRSASVSTVDHGVIHEDEAEGTEEHGHERDVLLGRDEHDGDYDDAHGDEQGPGDWPRPDAR